MKVAAAFHDEHVDLELPEDKLILAWNGPEGVRPEAVVEMVARALEMPRDYPSLRQAVVPGDHVAIAMGPGVPAACEVLSAVVGHLGSAGVEAEAVVVLSADREVETRIRQVPGVVFHRHDPEDRDQLAYLATTAEGHRIYLNRLLTDADFVLPIGRLAFDPLGGYNGPWSAIFPGMSDLEALQRYGFGATPGNTTSRRDESSEVCWLLGCQLQLGLLDGVNGPIEAMAGAGDAARRAMEHAVQKTWSLRADSRAELVVVGVGRPQSSSGIDDVARGLATARRLVQRGGRIVVLSASRGELGPSMQRLRGLDDPRRGLAELRRHESDPDFRASREVAEALAWADVYLLSEFAEDVTEDLGMIGLGRSSEVQRLIELSGSCLIVSQADQVRVSVADETE